MDVWFRENFNALCMQPSMDIYGTSKREEANDVMHEMLPTTELSPDYDFISSYRLDKHSHLTE